VLRSDYALLEDTVNGRLPGSGPQARQEAAATALTRLAGQALLRPYVDLAAASFMDDSAEALEVNEKTVRRHWEVAKVRLFQLVTRDQGR
jgi:hypothetical protein